MSSVAEIKAICQEGMVFTIKNKSIKEALQFIFSISEKMQKEPIKIVFTSTGKVLDANRTSFEEFLNDKITLAELIEDTSCIDLYRNIEDIETHDQTIDKGSLWIQIENETIILKDEDQFVEIDFKKELFEVIE
jgi:hypothetical protein